MTILKNTLFSSITLGLRFLSTAVLFIILARALGAEEFGRFTFSLSFTGLFLIVVDYGFNLLIVKEVAVSPRDAIKISSNILGAKVILCVVSSIILFLTLNIFNYPVDTKLIVYVLWVASIFYSFGLFFNTIFRGLNKFQYETYPTILLNGLQFALIIILLLLKFKTLFIAVAYLVSRVIYFWISLHLVNKKIGKLSFSFNVSNALKLLKESLPFGIHAILGTLYFQLDTVILSYFKGNSEVGHYQAAMRIVVASMIIYDIVVSSYFPLIANKFKIDVTGFKKDGLALNKYMLLIGTAIASCLLLYSDFIVKLLYGSEYIYSVIILQLLSVVIFLRFAGASYAVFITAADNQKLRAYGVAISVVVNVVLNFIFIPIYGAVGAAITSIITHIVLDAIYMLFSFRLTRESFLDIYCFRGLVIVLLGSTIGLYLKTHTLILSMAVFSLFIMTLFIFALNKGEKQMLKNIFNRIVVREA